MSKLGAIYSTLPTTAGQLCHALTPPGTSVFHPEGSLGTTEVGVKVCFPRFQKGLKKMNKHLIIACDRGWRVSRFSIPS